MMKKLFLLLLLSGIYLGNDSLQAQNIELLFGQATDNSIDPAIPRGICQCDTLGIQPGTSALRYFLTGPFNPNTDFIYEMGSPFDDYSSAVQLEIDSLWTVPSSSNPVDTFGAGQKIVRLIIPCDATLGPASIRIRNTNNSVSDTAFYFNINRIPDTARIGRMKRYGVGADTVVYENPYTNLDDIGLCTYDSLVIFAEQQPGASYQWNRNGSPIPMETNDSLVVKASGAYSVTIALGGGCSRTSKDTLVNTFLPPVSIKRVTLPFQPHAFHVDHPIHGFPLDSITFCESDIPVKVELDTVIEELASDRRYTYQWITDTFNWSSGKFEYINVDTTSDMTLPRTDTSRILNVDSSLISLGKIPINVTNQAAGYYPGYGRVYLIVNDGYCVDTSDALYFLMDSVPETEVHHRNYIDGVPFFGVTKEICMQDSVRLLSSYSASNIKYQWQKNIDDPNNPSDWFNVRSAVNPNVEDTLPYLDVDTTLEPWNPNGDIVYFRLLTRTYPVPYGGQANTICSYVSDYVAVRWFPESFVNLKTGQDAFVNQVDNDTHLDSISFCIRDSAVLQAPINPIAAEIGEYKYQWYKDTVIIGLPSKEITSVGDTLREFIARRSGTYYVTVDDGICQDTLDAYYVFVDSIPATTLEHASFTSPPKADPYDRCVTDSVRITAMDTVLPGWIYQWEWSKGDGVWNNLASETNPSIVVDTALIGVKLTEIDSFYFRLNTHYINQFGLKSCDFTSDSLEIRFYPLPKVSFDPSDEIGLCEGDSVRVIVEGDGLNFVWADGPVGASRTFSEPGSYPIKVTGLNGCVTEKTLVIKRQTAMADAGPDITVKSGEIVELTASGGVEYRWYSDKPLDFSDFLSQTIKVSKILETGQASDTFKIYVITTNGQGCRGLDSMNLYVVSDDESLVTENENLFNLFNPGGTPPNDVWDITTFMEIKGITGCEIMIMNRWGSVVYENKNFVGVWDGNDVGGNPLPDGTYYYVLSCNGQVEAKNAVTLIRNK